MYKKHVVIAALVVSLGALPACGGKVNKPQDEPTDTQATQTEVETKPEAVTNSQSSSSCLGDLRDWSRYELNDTPLSFGESGLEGPLTFETLASVAGECELEAVDESGTRTSLAFADILDSELKPAYPDGYGSMYTGAKLTIDDASYDLDFWDSTEEKTFSELVANNQFSLYSEDVKRSTGMADLVEPEYDDPNDIAGDDYILAALCEAYGRPAWVEYMEGWETAPTIFWEKDGYKFGVLVFDVSQEMGRPYVSAEAFYYFNDAAWGAYMNYLAEDSSYLHRVVPFDEFIAS